MATETVTVACKMPNGLICRIFEPRQEMELIVGGGSREVTKYYPNGQQFVLNGVAAEAKSRPTTRLGNGLPDWNAQAEVTDGFALTFGVPKALWDIWFEANKSADYIKNGLVFAHKQGASVRKQARDHEEVRSGLEPIDPENPGQMVEPTDEQKKRLRGNRLKA